MINFDNADRFHQRRHPRLKGFDYASPNYYFVTICTDGKRQLFGQSGKLNSLGIIADVAFGEIEKHFPGVTIDKYVVMPNHVHGIIVLQETSHNLSAVIGQYKSFVSKQIHQLVPELRVWQTSFHDHIIRDQKGYERIWNYIDGNPVRWQDDCYFQPEDR